MFFNDQANVLFLISPFIIGVVIFFSILPDNWIRLTMVFLRLQKPGAGLKDDLAEASGDDFTQFQNEGEPPTPGLDGALEAVDANHVTKQVEMIAEDPDARLARSGSGHNALTADVSLWQTVDETGMTGFLTFWIDTNVGATKKTFSDLIFNKNCLQFLFCICFVQSVSSNETNNTCQIYPSDRKGGLSYYTTSLCSVYRQSIYIRVGCLYFILIFHGRAFIYVYIKVSQVDFPVVYVLCPCFFGFSQVALS